MSSVHSDSKSMNKHTLSQAVILRKELGRLTMSEMISFKSEFDKLISLEHDYCSYLFQSFIGGGSITRSVLPKAIEIVAKIIRLRSDDDDGDDVMNKKFTFDKIDPIAVKQISSYLDLNDALRFAQINREIYIACHNPMAVENLDFNALPFLSSYSEVPFDEFTKLKSLVVSPFLISLITSPLGNKFKSLEILTFDHINGGKAFSVFGPVEQFCFIPPNLKQLNLTNMTLTKNGMKKFLRPFKVCFHLIY